MNLLVTGGAGYIGGVVVALLVAAGHEVTVVDDLSTGYVETLPSRVTFHRGGIHDVAGVLTVAAGFDGVLHFAARIAAGESVQRPELYWHTNVVGSLVLLDAIRADAAIGHACDAHGLGGVSLRYFNVAGAYLPDHGSVLGERHDPETHLIPIALEVAAGRREELQIFGDDYPTADGTCVRYYIHVADLAAAHLLALDATEPGRHRVYNLGNGNGFSNRQVVEVVPVVPAPRRSGDPAVLVASSARARAELGWVPGKPNLYADAWTFFRTRTAAV